MSEDSATWKLDSFGELIYVLRCHYSVVLDLKINPGGGRVILIGKRPGCPTYLLVRNNEFV